MEDKKTAVIYHGDCRDGFGSAFVFWLVNPNAFFFPGYYGELPKLDKSIHDTVYLLDFIYPLPVMQELMDNYKVTVIDHHQTAKPIIEACKVYALANNKSFNSLFDINESGVSLTWEYFNPTIAKPDWVRYIKDRDLWLFREPNSHFVNDYIGTWKFDFHNWYYNTKNWSYPKAVDYGSIVNAKVNQYVKEVAKNTNIHSWPLPDGTTYTAVPVVNAPQVDISELLNYILEEYKSNLVVGWWKRRDGLFQYSLRSKNDIDVSEIAKQYGGGGHKNAAGFQLDKLIF
jgi:oligoribonuclease NrnB/cAMP/cGMP phosphodiesterase (DHH superfamily)